LKIIKPVFFCCLIFISSNFLFAQNEKIDGHPAWIMQGNIYEVNVRQYTPEGTFAAFEKSLPRLKEMGVQTLWFMPMNPISKVDRKGALGSYYAVANYMAVNPEFGTMDDWKSLVKKCHNMGFKVMMDWVPNHTGADNYWLTAHPDFYVTDSTGKAISQFDWTDTRKLNFHNPVLEDSMIRCMKFWIDSTNIDGFRCDYAVGPTKEFWTKCIQTLKADKNIFMLAEADSAWLYETGFDATYSWPEFHTMVDIAAGKKNAYALDSVINIANNNFPSNGLILYFTSNHDENSWNKADYGTMPGASHAPFAVLTQTLPRSIPLIYSGQEEPFLDSVSFFYKDTITFHNYARAKFYSTLLHLREAHVALAANASFKKVHTSNNAAIYAFERMSGNDKILVIVNLSNAAQNFSITDADVSSSVTNIFTLKKEKLVNNKEMHLDAWGYLIYSFK
ncbi:MAG TPA: alpha-amylase family glycosyl hydrolase, partial [Parafilimonas sp.]|nr:alpha-amylase family glycosyl hydrolase [Parafilimonas sp.]